MLLALLHRFFSKKQPSIFNPEQAYCQAQRLLQYQVRLTQQADRAPVRPTPSARPKVAKATPRELVSC